ncbi:hypothetical protein [Virgibacillus sp. Bac332]|uniref:hypothetical protein n=1 Tax=Virgibacillus sp. Bac332 TaxID=2419842 RepID=UPI000EF4FF6E|nr:hypothetical protein [Virgibacillus sp. Bac332]
MKKILSYTNNEKGFMLPMVMFTIALVLIATITNIQLYQNNKQMTAHQLEQVKMESLIQITREKLKKDLLKDKDLKRNLYHLPEGNISVVVTLLATGKYKVLFSATTVTPFTFHIFGYLDITNEFLNK